MTGPTLTRSTKIPPSKTIDFLPSSRAEQPRGAGPVVQLLRLDSHRGVQGPRESQVSQPGLQQNQGRTEPLLVRWNFRHFKSISFLPHCVLTKSGIRTPVSSGNLMRSSTLWTLRFPKMYMGTLSYKGKILH